MNKKFSTLLAAFLVAGGLGSSAFAENLEVKTSEYFQLKDADGCYLIVGEGAVRDSLALIDELKSLNELNKTLWRVNVEQQKNADGLVTGYKYYLVNKVNGSVALTYEGASNELSSYYAPGAVVASGKWEVAADSYVPNTATVTFNSNVFDFSSTKNLYDASTKEAIAYKLVQVGDKIKLAKGEGDASKVTVADKLQEVELKWHADFEDAAKISFTGSKDDVKKIDLSASWLNGMANNAFNLSFNKDVSSSVVNPFSATSLRAAGEEVYSAAAYIWGNKGEDGYADTYNGTLEDANKVVSYLNQINQDAASLVKELKVAIDAEVEEFAQLPAEAPASDNKTWLYYSAPNATDIQTLYASLSQLKELLAEGDAKTNIEKLLAAVKGEDAIYYNSQIKDETGYIVEIIKDRVSGEETINALANDLDDLLKNAKDKVDPIVKATSDAISKYDAAIKAFATEIYRPNDAYVVSDVEFDDYKIDGKTPADLLKSDGDVNKMFASTDVSVSSDATFNPAGSLADLSTKMPNVTSSRSLMNVESDNSWTLKTSAWQAYAVVGQPDTYITVDTVYVAEREKYLGVRTMKLNRIGLDNNDKRTDKKADIVKYVLVPNVGDLATSALFKMTVDPTTTKGDIITISANAPKPTKTVMNDANTGKVAWFKDYKDEAKYFDYEQHVVIRTLGGVRTLSVTTTDDFDTSVEDNTKITFLEPDLATLVNNGDIFFIKMVSAIKDKNDKYQAVNSVNHTLESVKAAYKNVPATQWIVVKNNDNYTFENRDFEKSFKDNEKLYVVDESQMIYSAGADTFQLEKIDVEKAGHLGYKYISEEIQKISEFALSAVNYANMETPYYLTFDGNEDSILTVTSDKEEALALIPMIKDGKQVTEEYKMNDENLTKQFYQLITKDGKDTLYLNIDESDFHITVSQVPEDTYYLQFRSINDEPNAYEVLVYAYNDFDEEYYVCGKLSNNQDGEAVLVGAGTASAFVYDLVDNSTDIYKNFGFEGSTKVIISLNGDAESKVTKIGPFATVKRTGLDETIDADYSLIMDTAYVDHKDNIRYAYYITKPIVAADTAWNAEKFYMVSYADSVAAKRDNDTIKYSQDNLTRIGFVAAKRLGTDSLAITKAVGAAADTLNVTDKLGVTNATFAFAIDENNDEAYRIEVAPTKYVSYLNGILVEGAKEQAQLFNVNATDLTPTDNEEISVEAGVQVIGGKGAVTVQGAAGKTVTVYNFQGRALASTTLTSDNQTIAVPAGLVAVSVEGEPEAISVVVK